MENLFDLCKNYTSVILLELGATAFIALHCLVFAAETDIFMLLSFGLLILGSEFILMILLSRFARTQRTVTEINKAHTITVIVMTVCILISDFQKIQHFEYFTIFRSATAILSIIAGEFTWAVHSQRLYNKYEYE